MPAGVDENGESLVITAEEILGDRRTSRVVHIYGNDIVVWGRADVE